MTFFVDNCLPPSWAHAMEHLFGADGHHFVALRDKFKASTADEIWIPMLAAETTDWVIITCDEKISKRPHELKAWQHSGIPAFFLKDWDNQHIHKQHAAIVRRLPEFVDAIKSAGKTLGFRVPFVGRIVPHYSRLK